MKFTENTEIKKQFVQSNKFTQELNNLRSQLPTMISDFKKYYVFYNKNPEYQEYQTMFENIKGNLTNISGKLFTLSNEVQGNIDKINITFSQQDDFIKKEKDKNSKLKAKLGIIEDKSNASFELISNYKDIYNSHYLRNWGIFLSTLVIMSTITKVYKPRVS